MRYRSLLCAAATLLAFALRMVGLTRFSLWYDEAFSVVIATTEWSVFWQALLTDAVHPPGYYLLLRGFISLFGDSEFALRYPSVVAGTLAVSLTYQLGKILGGKIWGLAAALLLGLNPFALWYAQEARMYSLLLLLAVAAGYTFWRFAQRPTWMHWLWLVLTLAAGFTLHYFAFFFSLIQFIYIAANLQQTFPIIRRWTLAQVVAFGPFTPWAWAVINRQGGTFGIGWIHPVSLLDIPLTLPNLAFVLADSPWAWAALGFLLLAVISGLVYVRHLKQTLPDYLKFLLIWLGAPPLFVSLMSLKLPLYVDRHLIIILPALLLLSSLIVLAHSTASKVIMAGLVLVSVTGCVRLFSDVAFTKEAWRTTAHLIEKNEQPDDALIMQNLQNWLAFSYYYRGRLETEISVINREITPYSEFAAGHRRLWLVYRRPFEPTHALAGAQQFTWRDDPDPINLNWLLAHESSIVEEITLPGIHIVLIELAQ